MTSLLRTVTVLIIVTLNALVGAAAMAAETCPALPDVEWWTRTVPEVRRTVEASFKGSWDAYIDRWKQQRRSLQNAYNSGAAVEIKSRNLIFRNDELKNYIRLVDERIATLTCLKKENGDDAAIANFATAAGSNADSDTPRPDAHVANVEEGTLNVEVVAACQGKVATLQITNLGDQWPRLAEVTIYRTDTGGKLTYRKLRMANSQQMMFKVPDSAGDAGKVGIFVAPSWYKRKFHYDAAIGC